MGSPESEPGRTAAEGPVHRVSVREFHMGESEVTVEQYARYLEATGHTPPPSWELQITEPHFPVLGVGWRDAVAFCDWLTQREGIAHRLPPLRRTDDPG